MSAKAIREAVGKVLLGKYMESGVAVSAQCASVTAETNWNTLAQEHPWLTTQV